MKYKSLNTITISSEALLHNYNYFKNSNPYAHISPVLKSNAYGHGLVPIASFIREQLNPPFICVDSLYEAYELHKSGYHDDIFIMGYTHPDNYKIWKKLPFIFSAWDSETLLALNKHQPGTRVHLKLDTGMNRLGAKPHGLDSLSSSLKLSKTLKIEGAFSHLSSADIPKEIAYTNSQLRTFKEMVSHLENQGLKFKWKHIQATSGATSLRDEYFNLIRLGTGFYGYSPFSPHTKEGIAHRSLLKPALTLTSTIAAIKNIDKGERVGYGGTYRAKQSEMIAILPIGYNEGVPWQLSNKGQVLVGETICPIVGRVSMNMTAIKLTRNTKARVGDQVTMIDRDPSSPASVYSIASTVHEIPYTVLTGLHPTIRRELI